LRAVFFDASEGLLGSLDRTDMVAGVILFITSAAV
jgi:hypothetical protein